MKKKKVDCVEMRRQGGDRTHAILRDVTREERKAYWDARNRERHERRRRLTEKRKSA
jgi:hypothetical protein